MGVDFTLFAATTKELNELWPDSDPYGAVGGVYAKGADVRSIADLYAAITGKSCGDDEFLMIRTIDDNERLVLNVPDRVRAALATLGPGNLKTVQSKWSKTFGFELTGWDDEMAMNFLLQLGDYLRANPAKPLFIWICC